MNAERANAQTTRGFTLVEILIVVVILSILAALVIPQFTSASQQAMKSTLRDQLLTIDDIIEVYRVNNAGQLPTQDAASPFGAGGAWGILVSTNYLKDPPFNMFTGGSTVAAGTKADADGALKDSGTGWFYADSGTRLDIWAAGYDEAADKLSNE